MKQQTVQLWLCIHVYAKNNNAIIARRQEKLARQRKNTFIHFFRCSAGSFSDNS